MQASEEMLQTLMQASLGGDAVAHGALLRALLPVLRGFFRRRLVGRDDIVEDLVQEVLIAVHEKRATYDVSRPFGGWMFAIARYKMIDHLRRRGNREIPLEALDDLVSGPDEHGASDARRDLDALLATLSPKQADAIRATQLEGLSVAEAAQRQRISVADIKVSVHRGLKALAARIRGERP
jgi:RNA polymerase sigma-70 factor (ECF subfamily)